MSLVRQVMQSYVGCITSSISPKKRGKNTRTHKALATVFISEIFGMLCKVHTIAIDCHILDTIYMNNIPLKGSIHLNSDYGPI